MQSGDLVFVECPWSVALRSHRCDDGCPTRGLAVILDIAVEGQVQVLDSDGTYWIWPEDCQIGELPSE